MTAKTLFKNYVSQLLEISRRGDAREESFYPALATMLTQVAQAAGKSDVHVTTLPKSTEAGNPDFRLWNGTDRIIGYVEAKKPTEENLDYVECSEQLKRYRSTFPNLILTNFLEFRLYRAGERVESVILGRPFTLTRLGCAPDVQRADELWGLLDRFLGFSLPKAFTAESLAVELAKRTRFLRDVVAHQLQDERETSGGLAGFYEAFQTYLIGDLSPIEFADLYAQTITYGLFAARTRVATSGDPPESRFNRRIAFDHVPHAIGVLREVFRFVSMEEGLPAQLEWVVDDISEVLAVADAPGILDRYYREGKGSDPIVHFYETFLSEYDPEERERRGVYYTPEAAVSYIVRSLHALLKSMLGKIDGLASSEVTLLDPAGGTMTFVARAAQEAVHEFETKYGNAARENFIRTHILENFYAFELMMAPYAVGHLKMGFFLEELGHRLERDERVRFYLTNALEMEELAQTEMPFVRSLAHESRDAGQVKKHKPILVVLGNPPYSGISPNKGEWITGLIEDYKYVDGKHFGEKKHWLQDDYVKFLRLAQWKIDQAGAGIVGMITNHGYLDNPTFRGMRQSLMRTFDEMYVLDLHGNSLKREVCPDGSKDENVFDIRQGVAIAFFVKRAREKTSDAVVRHAELWGTRASKYIWLEAHDATNTQWRTLQPTSPFYFFVPRDEALAEQYGRFLSVPEIFPVNSVGIVTARDSLTIHWTADDVWRTVTVFSRMDPELAREAYGLGKDVRDWKVALAQKDLLASGPSRELVTKVLYRPFDLRYTYYTGQSRGFIGQPQQRVMRQMLEGDNLALIVPRQHKDEFGALVADCIGAHKSVAAYDINYYFPLRLHPEIPGREMRINDDAPGRRPNLPTSLLHALSEVHGREPSPEQIFSYIYAILYSECYREKYAEFLRVDFPRIPFTAEASLFGQLADLGSRLIELHLLRPPAVDPPDCRFQGEGDSRVGRGKSLRFLPNEQRLFVNETQYFEPVPEDVWDYRVGGYQVCEKWLKDRRDRHLDYEDVERYCRIVTALKCTIEIQQEIDELYPAVEANIVQFPAMDR